MSGKRYYENGKRINFNYIYHNSTSEHWPLAVWMNILYKAGTVLF